MLKATMFALITLTSFTPLASEVEIYKEQLLQAQQRDQANLVHLEQLTVRLEQNTKDLEAIVTRLEVFLDSLQEK